MVGQRGDSNGCDGGEDEDRNNGKGGSGNHPKLDRAPAFEIVPKEKLLGCIRADRVRMHSVRSWDDVTELTNDLCGVISLIIPCVGIILGVVWMSQGKPKGWKMLAFGIVGHCIERAGRTATPPGSAWPIS